MFVVASGYLATCAFSPYLSVDYRNGRSTRASAVQHCSRSGQAIPSTQDAAAARASGRIVNCRSSLTFSSFSETEISWDSDSLTDSAHLIRVSACIHRLSVSRPISRTRQVYT